MMLAAISRRAGDLRSFKMSLVDDFLVVESSENERNRSGGHGLVHDVCR